MDRMRAALDEVLEKVKVAIKGEPRSPVELLLDAHLPLDDSIVSFSPKNCSAAAIPTFVLIDLASRTNNIVDYPFILGRIWDILIQCQDDPNQLKKALSLLHYLLINGSIQVLKDCQDPVRAEFFEQLAAHYNRAEFEQYKFSKHLDVGAGVRKTASEIHHLLSHEREMLHVRRSAEKLHQSLSDRGLRSTYPSVRGESSSPAARTCSVSGIAYHDASRPPKYSDSLPTGSKWDDIGAKIVTHAGTVLDNLHRSDSRKDSTTTSSRHASNSSCTKEPQPTGSLTTTSVDLLGLEDLALEPAADHTIPSQQQQQRTSSTRNATSRTDSNLRLTATI